MTTRWADEYRGFEMAAELEPFPEGNFYISRLTIKELTMGSMAVVPINRVAAGRFDSESLAIRAAVERLRQAVDSHVGGLPERGS